MKSGDGYRGKITCVGDMIESIRGMPDNFIYRGQTNVEWEILPSLLRNKVSDLWVIFECLLVYYLATHKDEMPYVTTYDPFDLMITLQHFGIPTRMLDVTTDPYTALFFACDGLNNEAESKDGSLYLINKTAFANESLNSTKTFFQERGTEELYTRLRFTDIKLVTPLAKNPRLRSQHGQMLFFPFATPLNHFSKYVTLKDYSDLWKMEYECREGSSDNVCVYIYKKVDRLYKQDILQELDEEYGINQESIYCTRTEKIKHAEMYYKNLFQIAMCKAEKIMFKMQSAILAKRHHLDPAKVLMEAISQILKGHL